MNKSLTILDCTLRDGGYYNQWDFSDTVSEKYFTSMEKLPVDIVELGYRSAPQDGYLGRFFYSPKNILSRVRELAPSKQMAIMLNEKDCTIQGIPSLLDPCKGLVDIVRMAIAPSRFYSALELARVIKNLGFKVGFNIMYMSTINEETDFLKDISKLNDIVDYFSLVDSYGGAYPDQVAKIVSLCKSNTSVPIGFHGHNNLELAFANSLAAVEAGASVIDSTIMGMGRGAGNLKTELFLTHLATNERWQVDFNALSDVVNEFDQLQKVFEWGTNLPYMVSGANSLPQKDVMDWVTKRYYSINSIIRALQNQKKGDKDNLKLSVFEPSKHYKNAMVVGGGPSVSAHIDAMIAFLRKNQDICIIHASSKHAKLFESLPNDQYFCLVGNEGHRLESVFPPSASFNHVCILPPFPRKMGTYVPTSVQGRVFELREVSFSERYTDSHTSLAIQTALDLAVEELLIAGYDGYPNQPVSEKERELIVENNFLFDKAVRHFNKLASITATRYEINDQESIYQLLS